MKNIVDLKLTSSLVRDENNSSKRSRLNGIKAVRFRRNRLINLQVRKPRCHKGIYLARDNDDD